VCDPCSRAYFICSSPAFAFEGYGVVHPNWPYVDDVLFVNLKSMPAAKRIGFRCRMALANALFITRRAIFDRLFVSKM